MEVSICCLSRLVLVGCKLVKDIEWYEMLHIQSEVV